MDFTLQDILNSVIIEALPSGIALVMTLIALVGLILVITGLFELYQVVLNENTQRTMGGMLGQANPAGVIIKLAVGSLFVVPSLAIWRFGEIAFEQTSVTSNTLLSYETVSTSASNCDIVHYGFVGTCVLMGLIFFWKAGIHVIDQERGIDPKGVRKAMWTFIGALGLIFMDDLLSVSGMYDVFSSIGFGELCDAI